MGCQPCGFLLLEVGERSGVILVVDEVGGRAEIWVAGQPGRGSMAWQAIFISSLPVLYQ